MAPNCLWIASVPRVGSMWSFNVSRALARAAGYEVIPSRVPIEDDDMIACARAAISRDDSRTLCVVKVHRAIRSDVPRSKFIVPQRDIRDSVVSFMRFMDCSFEHAFHAARSWVRLEAHYHAFPNDRCLFVDYHDIVYNPNRVCERIADFADLEVSGDIIRKTVDGFTKEKVASRIQDIEETNREFGHKVKKFDASILRISQTHSRIFDRQSGFQSGHVSDYEDGDWSTILNRTQIALLDSLVRDLNP